MITEHQMRCGLRKIEDGCSPEDSIQILTAILWYYVRRFGGPLDHDVEEERREPDELFGVPPRPKQNAPDEPMGPLGEMCMGGEGDEENEDINKADWWKIE